MGVKSTAKLTRFEAEERYVTMKQICLEKKLKSEAVGLKDKELEAILEEMNDKLKGKPFAFISISGDDTKETLTSFLEKEKMPWVHWFADRKGILKDWNIRFYPTMYILDHKGVIRAKGLRGEELEKKVNELVVEAEKAKKS